MPCALRQRWAAETNTPLEYADAEIEGKPVQYPILLDAAGEPCLEMTNAFLLWYADLPTDEQPQDAIKIALNYITACANIARKNPRAGAPLLGQGHFQCIWECESR